MRLQRFVPSVAISSAVVLAAVACAPPPAPHADAATSLLEVPQEVVAADVGAEYPFDGPIALASSIVYTRTGNPDGHATVPAAAREENVANPDHVVGDGTPESCTPAALAAAVRGGGVTVFDCGTSPLTITLDRTLFTCNTHNCAHPWQGGIPVTKMVLDGGGSITLSGNGQYGIFYANACEEEFGWLSSHCNQETTPLIVFQNITLTRGNATSGPAGFDGVGGGGGGGAIAMRGGQFKAVNVTFADNRCIAQHSDAGGGAVRLTLSATTNYIVNSTFDNNRSANGGAISGLHASIQVLNSMITNNSATGTEASSGLGGNGGGIYGDGNTFAYLVDGTEISGNYADEGGPGIFYVSNNRTGTLTIRDSQIVDNTGEDFHTAPYRDIFFLGASMSITGSTVE